jgi:hypothetical protein
MNNCAPYTVDAMPDKYKAMVLVGAYAGLRWG